VATVFSNRSGEDLHTLIACLCVLFEDLRIEVAGIAAKELGDLDECGKGGRQLYFLRRSMATLHEFASVLSEIDQLPSFQVVRAGFSTTSQRHWPRALTYFRRHERYIARIRHNVGGHFGKQAAALALANLLPNALGKLEIALYGQGGGAKLFFTNEIAATATLLHVRGTNSEAKARRMIRHALVAFRHATFAVDCITANYLWDRFGK
jgi:hypothetical protein